MAAPPCHPRSIRSIPPLNPRAIPRYPYPMPSRILPACTTPGCPSRSIDKGKCKAHLGVMYQQQDERRGSSADRGYDHAWRRFRAWLCTLPEFALCCECEREGRVTPRHDIDHIIPISAGGARLSKDNCQPLCKSHHSAKTARENLVAARAKS